jgi:hypothetical protein
MTVRPIIWAAATTAALLVGSAVALAGSNATAHRSLKASINFVSTPGDGPGGCVEGGTNGDVVTCHVTLSNPKSSNGASITRETVGTPGPGDTVAPSSGTLGNGKSVKVTMITACHDWSAFLFLDLTSGDIGAPVMFDSG